MWACMVVRRSWRALSESAESLVEGLGGIEVGK